MYKNPKEMNNDELVRIVELVIALDKMDQNTPIEEQAVLVNEVQEIIREEVAIEAIEPEGETADAEVTAEDTDSADEAVVEEAA